MSTTRSLLAGLLMCGLLGCDHNSSPTSPTLLAPTLVALNPERGVPGTSVDVTFTGTGFAVGGTSIAILNTDTIPAADRGFRRQTSTTALLISDDVTISDVAVRSPTLATASFVISDDAIPGPREITVTTPGGTSAARIFTVEIGSPTIGTFTANPLTISSGETATLTWSGITNASECVLDYPGAPIGCGDGTVPVTPVSTTTYTLTARGAAGTAIATVRVTVNPAPTIGTFTANPSTIRAGASSTLAWSGVANATICAIDHGVAAIACADGTLGVSPASTTTYTLTAMGAGGSRTATVTVNVTVPVSPAPDIAAFTASPTAISAGAASTLAWSGVTNATACAIDQGAGNITCGNGTLTVRPAATTTYTLTATGPGGSHNATTTVTVTVPAPVNPTPPIIGAFTASPTTITAGASSTLSWSGVTNAATCAIDHGLPAIACGNGTIIVSPASTTTYTFTATGPDGSRTATATLTVNAASSSIGAFTASPTTISAGASSTLTWSGITNATTCGIDHGAAAITCANGSLTVTPAVTTTYTFTTTGPGGSQTATATVTVNAVPTIGAFTAGPTTINAGASTTLAWSGVANAATCAIDHGAAAIACGNGTLNVSPASTTTYTFTATGAGGSRTATATVTVNAAPAIGLFTAVPSTVFPLGDAVIEWSAITNATTCSIDHAVGVVSCLNGNAGVKPFVTTDYILTATGPGGTVTATTRVTVVSHGSATFNLAAGMQSFTVPSGITSVVIRATGAGGGSGTAPANQGTGQVGTFAVSPGSALLVAVGGAGLAGVGNRGGGGGGGSFVFNSAGVLMIAAGGGGGGSSRLPGLAGNSATSGRDGWGTDFGLAGASGAAGGGGTADSSGGGGGGVSSASPPIACAGCGTGGGRTTFSASGAGGIGGTNGGNGGIGGGGGGGGTGAATSGGGGGGGYSGGGGGGSGGGGGGGGSLNTGTNQAVIPGALGGSGGAAGTNGTVTITW